MPQSASDETATRKVFGMRQDEEDPWNCDAAKQRKTGRVDDPATRARKAADNFGDYPRSVVPRTSNHKEYRLSEKSMPSALA